MPAWLLAWLVAHGPKAVALAKKFYKSKAFWPTVTTGGILGATGISELGRKGERKLTKEQMELQRLLGESSAEVTKKMSLESKENTEKYIKELLKAKEAEDKQAREDAMMQAFMASQDRQIGMAMQAIQGMSARPTNVPRSGGMLATMRSTF